MRHAFFISFIWFFAAKVFGFETGGEYITLSDQQFLEKTLIGGAECATFLDRA